MVSIMRLTWIVALAAVLVSCSETPRTVESPTTPWLPTAVAPAVEGPAAPKPAPVWVPPTAVAEPTAAIVAPVTGERPEIPDALNARVTGSPGTFLGLKTMEENIVEADVIARVRLLSIQPATTTKLMATMHRGEVLRSPVRFWAAALEFRFAVSEYLKGSGGNEISAFVFEEFKRKEDAEAAAAVIASAHDSRWDDREAVVFLRSTLDFTGSGFQLPADHYWFGDGGMLQYTHGGGFSDLYTLSSFYSKLWLPEATGGARGASTDKVFMLAEPQSTGSTARSTTRSNDWGGEWPADPPPASSISLANLKSKVTTIEAQASAGGTPEYRECVRRHYWIDNLLRYFKIREGADVLIRQTTVTIASGLPEGQFVGEDPQGTEGPSMEAVEAAGWFEGPDKDHFRYAYVDKIPGHNGVRGFDMKVVTARPMPAGEYRAHPNGVWYGGVVCGRLISSHALNVWTVDLTVEAPPRTVHEAFFDPVDIGAAVGADGSNGVIKPAAFSFNGATTTISSLKWENGAVTLGASPTSTLAGHAIDFIDVTGTTTLSLTSDNASTTPLTWTVPDKPWSDGDLLMLRIREPVAPPPSNPVTGLMNSG